MNAKQIAIAGVQNWMSNLGAPATNAEVEILIATVPAAAQRFQECYAAAVEFGYAE